MTMQPGDYNQPFEIVRTVATVDDYGDPVKATETVYKGFAKVTNLSGREYWEAFAVEAQDTLKFHTRWHPVLAKVDTRNCRIAWQGRELDITAVDNIAYGNALCTIKAREVRK